MPTARWYRRNFSTFLPGNTSDILTLKLYEEFLTKKQNFPKHIFRLQFFLYTKYYEKEFILFQVLHLDCLVTL